MPRIRLAGLLALLPLFAQADVIVGSWNIKHLGWNNDKAMPQVAHVANHFDLLAVQELMDPAALEALEGELEAISGEAWSSMASHALGRSSYEEHYGFLWREREVAYEDGAVVFIDHGDVFSREPYSARFRDVEGGEAFTLATVHVVYGDSVGDRLPEIEALADYWQWLGEVHPETPRLLAGDFNLPPDHPAWRALRERGARPAITEGHSTLATTAGQYASLYDNLWYDAGRLAPDGQGILRFPELLPLAHQVARDRVSDHAPVYLALNGAALAATQAGSGELVATQRLVSCIDLNDSAATRLAELPHVGPARAADIIAGRPWRVPSELTRIAGIGDGRLREIRRSGLLCAEKG
ncbi:endonuclease/exonuclease/phosphatase family protein [Halomonas sp. CKK8]|uniref:endonuclease/exonuclease/phosphatase family protein n=1 Tax=Halomonas sp. CKK8 TaxID=3036127 RepID=UPI0024150C86|nr:endonuclease/exonuclease/phosphatase family protein [Halomonas sp. CKK8]WFM71127.1 endonuclease [Halomonas sp. CKK8]